jgi:hypothetical protein
MPLGSSLLASYIMLTMAMVPPMMAIASKPDQADIYAICGAMLGAMLAGLEAVKNNRDYFRISSVILASSGVGTVVPGVLAYRFLSTESVAQLTWHTWAFAGLICSLGGWALVHGCMTVFIKRIPRALDRQMNRFDPPDAPQ